MHWWHLPAAYLLDLFLGDPAWLTHPVVLLGRWIAWLDRRLPRTRSGGVLLWLLVVIPAYGLTWGLLALAARLSPWAGHGVSLALLWSTLAARGLADAGTGVLRPLLAGDLPAARSRVGWIVGRDTAHLDEREVARAAVETVAENASDGVVAPILYAALGGAPLAMAYKAVNTLDSMVGYKNERYLHLGWASARMDDLWNWIPARLTALLLVAAAAPLGYPACRAAAVALRDARLHPSPNSGWPEAAVAGALGIRLGGLNLYGGRESFRAYLGDPLRPMEPLDIQRAVALMHVAGLFALVLLTTVRALMAR